VPADAGETIRIIRIGGYDACPCRGEHVARSGDIGGVRIISTSFDAGVLRIRFTIREQ